MRDSFSKNQNSIKPPFEVSLQGTINAATVAYFILARIMELPGLPPIWRRSWSRLFSGGQAQ